jgi:hypothetical protein
LPAKVSPKIIHDSIGIIIITSSDSGSQNVHKDSILGLQSSVISFKERFLARLFILSGYNVRDGECIDPMEWTPSRDT